MLLYEKYAEVLRLRDEVRRLAASKRRTVGRINHKPGSRRFLFAAILAAGKLAQTLCARESHFQCVRGNSRSSIFFPVISCAPTQRGCLPRPDQVSKGRSGF